MNEEQIKLLIEEEVKKQLKTEKEELAKKIRSKLKYIGDCANSWDIITVFENWAKQ